MTITLDKTFGGDGIVTTDIGGYSNYWESVTVQNDGKILVGGATTVNNNYDFVLARYNTDGSLDNSFNSDGTVTTDFIGYEDLINSLTIQSDGKILVAGWTKNSNGDSDFALVKYNKDGSLDTSFGTNGKVTTDFGGYYDYGWYVKVQNDSKILVTGGTGNSNGEGDFALARYNTNGSLDTSFGTNGKVTTDFEGNNDSGKKGYVQSDGKILVSGFVIDGNGDSDFALARYNADGSLDTSFGVNGKVTTDFGSYYDYGNSITVQSDGKILVAGTADNDFALVRYNTNGLLDTSFGSEGKVTTDFVGYEDIGWCVTVQSDGKILVSGWTNNSNSQGDIGLLRYNKDGSLDTSFGTNGKYTIDVGGDLDLGRSVTVQSDGKIVVAGNYIVGNTSDFAVIRLNNTTSTTNNQPTSGADKLIGTAGADTIDGLAGNDTISDLGGNDRLLGGAGDDSINGRAGDDAMIGGTGNDIYIVNSAKDLVTEALNAGTDSIFSTTNYTLPANVEHLTLQGTKAINGNGNTLNNRITGNTAANRINGGGGNDTLIGGGGNDTFLVNPGNDVLTGGAGADKFTYNTNAKFTKTAVGLDTITDFVIAQADKIVLDKNTFPKISSIAGSGFSQKSEFAKVTTNTAAAASAADIVYNSATGGLFYNENGTAAGYGTGGQFLTLTNKPALTATQFIIQA